MQDIFVINMDEGGDRAGNVGFHKMDLIFSVFLRIIIHLIHMLMIGFCQAEADEPTDRNS